ncbi:MAG: hypothetical protein ABIL68_04550 [bacterium]
MEAHAGVERKLKTDIIRKNILRKDIEKKFLAITRWTEQLQTSRNKQKRKKMEASAARYREQIAPMKIQLLSMGEDLEKWIKEEMAYSEEEVKAFQARLEKDTKELQKVQKNLEEAEKKKTDEKTPENKHAIKKLLKEESDKVKKDEQELESEEKDKSLFTLELKRIAVERKLYGI